MRGAPWALGLGVAAALGVGLAAVAQSSNQPGGDSGAPASSSGASSSGASSSGSSSSSETPPGVPLISPPPEAAPPPGNAVGEESDTGASPSNSAAAKPAGPKPPPPPPPAPPKPVRAAAAVMQALDKVTAETMRFGLPIGKPIRYKNLVFVVKACESTGLGGPSPQYSAYVVIDSAPLASGGAQPPPPRQVFKGWMFSNSPGLNAFQHPIYDAWLISCTAVAPPT
jgi:hypothetical protein